MPVILILFIIFLLVYNLKLKKVGNGEEIQDYVSKERDALFIRKKSLDDLEYIKPELDDLPLLALDDHLTPEEKKAYEKQILIFETQNLSMVDLRGKNNTELKMEYGPANLETLAQYEGNYILFLQQLLDWGKSLIDADRKSDAIQVLEKGISLGTDLSQNYILLSDLYFQSNQMDKFEILLQQAQNHPSIMMKKVIQHMNDLTHSTEKNEEEHV